MASIGLAPFCGVGTSRLQRPSLRAGANTRHPMLSAAFDDSRKACRRRPHLYDGCLARPGSITGRLHQHPGPSLTQHRHTAYAALRAAPSGKTPVVRTRHRAMRHGRATATIPMRLRRLPPPPKRSRHPATQGTLRLGTHPTPGPLHGHPAPMPVPRLGHPLFPRTLAAVIWRRCSTRSAAHLATLLPRTPAKKGPHHQPGPLAPEAFQLPQLTHLLEASFLRAVPYGTTLGCPRRPLCTQELVMGIHPQHTTTQAPREG